MAWVAGIRFKPAGKIYFFECENLDLNFGDGVIVETIRGIEYGTVATGRRQVADEELVLPLKPVIRKATEEDTKAQQANHQKEKEAL